MKNLFKTYFITLVCCMTFSNAVAENEDYFYEWNWDYWVNSSDAISPAWDIDGLSTTAYYVIPQGQPCSFLQRGCN